MDNVMILTTHQLSKLPIETICWIFGLSVLTGLGLFLCILGLSYFSGSIYHFILAGSILCGAVALMLLVWAPRENAGIEHQLVTTGPVNIEIFLDNYEIVERENNFFTVIEK